MIRIKHLLILGVAFTLGVAPASGQILNKIKQKAEKKAEQALEKKLGLGNDNNNNNSNTSGGSGSAGNNGNNPNNTTGGGVDLHAT